MLDAERAEVVSVLHADSNGEVFSELHVLIVQFCAVVGERQSALLIVSTLHRNVCSLAMHVDACVYNHATVLLDVVSAKRVSARVNAVPVYLVAHAVDAWLNIRRDSERRRINARFAAYGSALAVLILIHRISHEVFHGVHAVVVVVNVVIAVFSEVDVCVSAHPRTAPVEASRHCFADFSAQTVVKTLYIHAFLFLLVHLNRLCAVAACELHSISVA